MKKKFELIKDIKVRGIDNTNNVLLEQVKQEQETIKNDLGDLGNQVNENTNEIDKLKNSVGDNLQVELDKKLNKNTWLNGVDKIYDDGSNLVAVGTRSIYDNKILQLKLGMKDILTGKENEKNYILFLRTYGVKDEDHTSDSRIDVYTTKYINELEDTIKSNINETNDKLNFNFVRDIEQSDNKLIVSFGNQNGDTNGNKEIEIDTTKNPFFWQYEVRFFDTKQHFLDKIATPKNLTEGVDYEIVDSTGRYLMFGNDHTIGGSNSINENNLPYKEWGFDVSDHYGKYSSYRWFLAPGNFTNISMNSVTQSAAGDISYSGGTTIERLQFKWSIGAQTQQDFKPKYKEVFAVKFLKDIY